MPPARLLFLTLLLTSLHLATDHSYSGQRIALATSILNWLATLGPK